MTLIIRGAKQQNHYSNPVFSIALHNLGESGRYGLDDYEGTPTISRERVYFARCADRKIVKVGTSTNVPKRVKALSRRWGRVELIGSINGDRTIEELMHERFADHRVHGEWFDEKILPGVIDVLEDDPTAQRAYEAVSSDAGC